MSVTAGFLKFALLGAEWVMVLLVGLSVVSIGILVERALHLARTAGNSKEFLRQLTDRLSSGEQAANTAAWCAGQHSLEACVAAVGLQQGVQGLRSAEESMEATLAQARPGLDRGLVILATLGNNAPFLGLFGTILGIIQAFHALATEKGAGPEVVMASISEALVAAAVGLLVAIPAVVGYNLFQRAIRTRLGRGEMVARVVLAYLSRQPARQGE